MTKKKVENYRITVGTLRDRKEYSAEVKRFGLWAGINICSESSIWDAYDAGSRKEALRRINRHYEKTHDKAIVEVEYITK